GTIDLWQMLSFLRTFPADIHDKRYCSIEQVRRGTARIQTSIRLLIFPSISSETESGVTPLSKAGTLQELVTKCMVRRNTNPQIQERLFLLLSRLAEQASGYQISIARGANDGPQIVH